MTPRESISLLHCAWPDTCHPSPTVTCTRGSTGAMTAGEGSGEVGVSWAPGGRFPPPKKRTCGRTILADDAGVAPRLGERDDAGRRGLLRRPHGRGRQGVLLGQGGIGPGPALVLHDLLIEAGVIVALLGLTADEPHNLDRAHRVLAPQRLRPEHDGVGPVEDGVRDVGRLGPRRARRGDHRVAHPGHDCTLPPEVARLQHGLLNPYHLLFDLRKVSPPLLLLLLPARRPHVLTFQERMSMPRFPRDTTQP